MPAARAILAETARMFDLGGRTARAAYLWFLFAATCAFAVGIALCIRLLPSESIATGTYVLTAIFYLPVTAAGVRRLHDVGESGTLMLDPLKPAIGFFIVMTLIWLWMSMTSSGTLTLLMAVMFFTKPLVAVVAVIALFVIVLTLMFFSHTMGLLLLPPQPGPNKYGPNPNEVPL
ncbi:DUF805 domain-containing protein [uncultured Roseovarius sp.]|uniref:DUF805 domain-containing protein n=1 Tax=uncultured Roseovarius sp. TaxID=293344 RepID=UPI00263688BB|nr:DUF805 domain-containing protein [uncultured Roseovarius sp.]